MKIGILGTGTVGTTLGSKLVQLGHEVKLGSRTSNNVNAQQWVKQNGNKASHGTFADAAQHGEILINCTAGGHSLEALKSAGAQNLRGKVLIDVANPIDNTQSKVPRLIPELCNTTSLAEEIQKAYPETRVVKTFNTVNSSIMTNPGSVTGEHHIFISGNDHNAKSQVREMLSWFGWKNILDLGDITCARAQEMMLPLWMRLYSLFQSANFNFRIQK